MGKKRLCCLLFAVFLSFVRSTELRKLNFSSFPFLVLFEAFLICKVDKLWKSEKKKLWNFPKTFNYRVYLWLRKSKKFWKLSQKFHFNSKIFLSWKNLRRSKGTQFLAASPIVAINKLPLAPARRSVMTGFSPAPFQQRLGILIGSPLLISSFTFYTCCTSSSILLSHHQIITLPYTPHPQLFSAYVTLKTNSIKYYKQKTNYSNWLRLNCLVGHFWRWRHT